MKRSLVGKVLVGAAVGALSVGAAQAQELKNINFMSANDGSCSVYPQFAMQAFGFLEKEGYKVTLLDSDTNVPYVAFLSNGDADVAMLDAAETLTARASGQEVKVVYETHQFAPEGIVVNRQPDPEPPT
jgi:NitT/TauT family transport system substrate-binding protein